MPHSTIWRLSTAGDELANRRVRTMARPDPDLRKLALALWDLARETSMRNQAQPRSRGQRLCPPAIATDQEQQLGVQRRE
jgi:hypothetical protein